MGYFLCLSGFARAAFPFPHSACSRNATDWRWQDIGELGAIAVIRTFLNYFLEMDLDSAEASGEVPRKEKEVTVEVVLTRFVADLVGRVHGPLTFRLIPQTC